jgi:hypothetical protein
MSIQSLSFWQQDQSFWQNAQAQGQASTAESSLINVMGQAETNLGKGLAAIANGTALDRVKSQLTAEIQSVLQGTSGSSSTSSTSSPSNGSSTASTSSSSAAAATPATGTGTVPLTTSTSLSSLGILPGGTITVGTGANTTTYTSTGNDTIADLLNAINLDLPTNANVTANLNVKGQLVITSRDTKSSIFIGGSGTDAAAIGFGLGNDAFLPKQAASSSAASSSSTNSSSADSSSSSTASSTASSTTGTSSAKTAVPSYLALAEQNVSAAEGVLSAAGVSGSLVDLLA